MAKRAWADMQDGKTFGKLTVICRGSNAGKHPKVVVQCSCGTYPKQVLAHHLKSGKVQSCGCRKSNAAILAEVTKALGRVPAYARWLTGEI